MAFLAPGDQARAGLGDDGITDHQPARGRGVGAAHVAAARPAQGPSPTTCRTGNDDVALFEIGHVFRRPASPDARACPTSASTSPSASPARRRPARCSVWWALGGAPRPRRRDAAGRRRRRACTRPASADIVGRRRGRRRRRRGRSRRARGLRRSPSGWPGSRSTSAACSTCRTANGRFVPFSRFPSSDIDLAFEVPDDVPAAPMSTPPSRGAGEELLVDVEPVRRLPRRRGRRGDPQPRLPAAVPGAGPHPHRRRGRRRSPAAHCRRRAGRACEAAGLWTRPRRLPPRPPAPASAAPSPRGRSSSAPGSCVAGIGAYLFLAIAARALGPSEYAPLAVLWALVWIVGPGFFLPVEQEVGRALADRRSRGIGARPVLRRAATLAAGLLGIVLVFTASCPRSWSSTSSTASGSSSSASPWPCAGPAAPTWAAAPAAASAGSDPTASSSAATSALRALLCATPCRRRRGDRRVVRARLRLRADHRRPGDHGPPAQRRHRRPRGEVERALQRHGGAPRGIADDGGPRERRDRRRPAPRHRTPRATRRGSSRPGCRSPGSRCSCSRPCRRRYCPSCRASPAPGASTTSARACGGS